MRGSESGLLVKFDSAVLTNMLASAVTVFPLCSWMRGMQVGVSGGWPRSTSAMTASNCPNASTRPGSGLVGLAPSFAAANI